MLQLLYKYVASLCSQCFICYSDVCCKCVYLDVAYVSQICYKCFIWMLRMFAMVFKCFKVFLQVFQMHVSSVISGCFKNRSDVAHRMCVGSGRGRERYPCRRAKRRHRRAMFGQRGPRHGRAKTGAGKQTAVAGIRVSFSFSCDSWTLKLDQIAMDPWNIG
jgi:hypothetical protein